MRKPRVYLDHNATTPLRPEAQGAVAAAMSVVGNPSSVHCEGRAARRIVEDARESVAELVGAEPSQVVFTSGGSEANALALAGCGRRRVLVSAVEHSSVVLAVDGAESIPVDGDGVVVVAALEEMLARSEEPAAVSVMLANNETGVIQPVAEIAAIGRRHGAVLHCDAVQAPGRLGIDVRALGADMLSLSAHKLGASAGCGAIVVNGVHMEPVLRGGGQERRRRAGTENVVGLAGFFSQGEQFFVGKLAQARFRQRADLVRRVHGIEERRAGVRAFGHYGRNISIFRGLYKASHAAGQALGAAGASAQS